MMVFFCSIIILDTSDEDDYFAENESSKIETDFNPDEEIAYAESQETALEPAKNEVPQTSTSTKGKFVPIVSTNQVHNLNRDDTMRVLMEVKKIADEAEQYEVEITSLQHAKSKLTIDADIIRTTVSKGAKTIIWTVTIIAFLIGCLGGPLCIITGVGALIIMNLTVKKADLKKHEAENNAKADEFIRTNIDPVQTRLNEVFSLRDDLNSCGRLKWAKDVVGNDMFYSACIQDLYNLVKLRRADSLKEALNKYDDTQYKARMQEMQAAIQNASEISAAESVKQTALSKQIEKNTHQTATAAQATAHHTREIEKNTRRFR